MLPSNSVHQSQSCKLRHSFEIETRLQCHKNSLELDLLRVVVIKLNERTTGFEYNEGVVILGEKSLEMSEQSSFGLIINRTVSCLRSSSIFEDNRDGSNQLSKSQFISE